MKNPVRKAASLILCRENKKLTSFYDYEILLLKRKSMLESWGSMMVFPGGKFDQMEDVKFANMFRFSNYAIATALRQCFEETGIFLTKQPLLQTQKIKSIHQMRLKYVASQFISSDINLLPFFYQLAQITSPQLNILPFTRLITIPIIKNRFDATFFLHKLQPHKFINFPTFAQNPEHLHQSDNIIMCGEYNQCNWYNPVQILQKFTKKQISLAPPQFIMLNIMSNFQKFHQLSYFINNCSQNSYHLAPNVVSIVDNVGYERQKFPFAATLVGDKDFPFQKCISNQTNQDLIQQLNQYAQRQKKQQNGGKNRFLFSTPKQFFQDHFSVECTIPNSILNKFQNSKQLAETLKNYQ